MIALGVLACLLSLACAALLWRARAQRRHRRLSQIGTPNGIDERGFVAIGGIEQWITLRGHDRANPVLLVLHGGPGASLSAIAFALFPGLEKHFVVAHWDQRGAGRTFGRNGRRGSGELSIERMTADGVEVAAHLCERLERKRIFLCAISWGSVLALGMIKRRPELFAAYVGTGQIVDMLGGESFAYRTLLGRARARGRKAAVAALERIGPPPFGVGRARRIWQQWLLRFAPPSEQRVMREMPLLLLSAPDTSLIDVWHTLAGVVFSYARLFDCLMNFRAEPYGWTFRIPIYFLQGTEDLQTPTSLVQDFFRRIRAPSKAFVPIRGGGHFVVRSMGREFVAELVARLGPEPSLASGD